MGLEAAVSCCEPVSRYKSVGTVLHRPPITPAPFEIVFRLVRCGHRNKMLPVHSFVQLLCLATVLVLSSAPASASTRSRTSPNAPRAPKVDRAKYVHWGPQYFLGWLPARSRRSEMDNRIDTFASPPSGQHQHDQVSPEAAAVGESIMEEFLLFLTLKDAGLLDLCMQFK